MSYFYHYFQIERSKYIDDTDRQLWLAEIKKNYLKRNPLVLDTFWNILIKERASLKKTPPFEGTCLLSLSKPLDKFSENEQIGNSFDF